AAWVYYKNGKYAEAKKYIDIALKKITPDAARLYHAGMIYAKTDSPFEARNYLARAINRNPHFSPVHAPIAAAKVQELGKIASQDVVEKAAR
ncbi:MAG: hypothetical protein H8F28_07275, partial [Fibrella sp.]|nr:hypothetical protein [Armatimonadota bacterium]